MSRFQEFFKNDSLSGDDDADDDGDGEAENINILHPPLLSLT